MFTLLVLLAAIPIVLLADLWRGLARWRRVDLPTRNSIRAGLGAALIALALALWAHGFGAMMPIGGYALAGGAVVGLVYLAGGVACARSALSFDPFSLAWWGVGLVGCVALLLFKDFIQWPSWLT